MAQQFDPAQFVDMETTEELVRRPPLAVQDYTAMVGEVKTEPWTSKDGTKSGILAKIPLKLQVPPDQQATIGGDTVQLTDRIFLDLTENGTMDYSPGKNGQLRRYRDALGMNKAGEPFSMRRMTGQILLVKLSHELYNGEVQERIDGVAKAG